MANSSKEAQHGHDRHAGYDLGNRQCVVGINRAAVENVLAGKSTGRPPANWRQCLNGIIYQMRTGCQWNKLPKQFGDDSTVHRWFQRWAEHGVLERLWTVLVEHCDELRGVQWKWQAADGSLAKARFGGPMSDRIRPIGQKMVRRRTS